MINKTKKQSNKTILQRIGPQRAAGFITALVMMASGGGYYAYASAQTAVQTPRQDGIIRPVTSSGSTIPATNTTTPSTTTSPPASTTEAAQTAATKQSTSKPAEATKPKAAAAASKVVATDAAVLQRLAGHPTARWFGDWNSDVRASVSSYISTVQAAGQLPVVVAYNIPNRDCGGESAGGVGSAASYAAWIRQFAAGVAGRSVMIILEPDAVAADCFNASRADMLSDAIGVLQVGSSRVYVDAGNPSWRTAADMATRLSSAGIAGASGFSLNVANFQTTNSNISYGSSVSALVGGKHFVIDTSRNSNGPSATAEWCNPAGRALGQTPSTQTGYGLVDAFLWIKVPGESDGRCGPAINGTSAPAAGGFWPEYALMLARNAGW